MVNVVIILILMVLLAVGIQSSVKHFKGEGSCCGGSGTVKTRKPRKKKLNGPVIGKKTIRIQGMHCDHCVQSVTRELNKIEGASAKVNLKEQKAVVSFEREIDDAELIGAVEAAGFQVVSIQP